MAGRTIQLLTYECIWWDEVNKLEKGMLKVDRQYFDKVLAGVSYGMYRLRQKNVSTEEWLHVLKQIGLDNRSEKMNIKKFNSSKLIIQFISKS